MITIDGKYIPDYKLDMSDIIRYLGDDAYKSDHKSLMRELDKHLEREENLFGGGNGLKDVDNIRGPVKKLALEHTRVSALDEVADIVGKEVLLEAEPIQALLGEHATWYARVVLATAWWSHLDSIRQSVLNALMTDVPADRECLRARILELYRSKVVVRFTTGEKFYATTEGGDETKRTRLLEYIQAEYGLENLCLFHDSGYLLPIIVDVVQHMIWQRARARIASDIEPGGDVAITVTLSLN